MLEWKIRRTERRGKKGRDVVDNDDAEEEQKKKKEGFDCVFGLLVGLIRIS